MNSCWQIENMDDKTIRLLNNPDYWIIQVHGILARTFKNLKKRIQKASLLFIHQKKKCDIDRLNWQVGRCQHKGTDWHACWNPTGQKVRILTTCAKNMKSTPVFSKSLIFLNHQLCLKHIWKHIVMGSHWLVFIINLVGCNHSTYSVAPCWAWKRTPQIPYWNSCKQKIIDPTIALKIT